MPIGVPRIIYCWGEELPAQWTDIYNFIFRRRMVFLMQYLDDELCNQICGLLINIHMEDRSKELEKKEMEKSSSLSRSSGLKSSKSAGAEGQSKTSAKFSALSGGSAAKSVEDLLTSEDDLAIDQNNTLEQYTLQKITMEWLNWNAQFFDYSDEPYLYYLADILSKDFSKETGNLMYSEFGSTSMSQENYSAERKSASFENVNAYGRKPLATKAPLNKNFFKLFKNLNKTNSSNSALDVYSPFRQLANFAANNYDLNKVNPLLNAASSGQNVNKIIAGFDALRRNQGYSNVQENTQSLAAISKLFNNLGQDNLSNQLFSKSGFENGGASENVLSQRRLKREYLQDRVSKNFAQSQNKSNSKMFNYLDLVDGSFNAYNSQSYDSASSNSQFYRKQTERTIQEEESKKVFVIINSFGGSVGNGITVHDALQFIKAGSLTLGLGVAASAASLVLAGGTIGERYVTEGCHVMIHQPEGGLNGQASDIWIDANEIMKIRLDVAEIYSLSTYRPRHKILRDLDRDFYLTATETIQYGLADEIATNEVMHSIIEMTSKVWDFHDAQQQRLLETRESASAGLDTQTQN
jgi:ATP-dependent Clp protease, protease subunit